MLSAAGSGMGADAARRLAADGFAVAILSSSGKGEALANELDGVGANGSNRSGGGACITGQNTRVDRGITRTV